MGIKTKIDWCDSSWNPVTGCEHGCPYCYARGIANRFGWHANEPDINERVLYEIPVSDGRKVPYPFDFQPTFHQYRLGEPAAWTKTRNIFVCSMADLFGEWVPDEWVEAVIAACLKAPQHRYLFLTKNPRRYINLIDNGIIPEDRQNFWLGSTATTPETEFLWYGAMNTFVSIEPILTPFKGLVDKWLFPASKTNWIIIGAETGNRKNKVIPRKKWIDDIVSAARRAGTPVFMKESLREIMGDDFRQEFPWEARR